MRPDILLIILDTQRADRLSCYGFPQTITPHLDQLAADSYQYMQAVAPGPWTVPTHASIFSGLYPTEHTLIQMDGRLPDTVQTLAERLQIAGYHTASFSNNPLIGVIPNGLARGFDEIHNFNAAGAGLLTQRLNWVEPAGSLRTRLTRQARYWLSESLGYSNETGASALAPLVRPLWNAALKARGGDKQANSATALAQAGQLFVQRQGVNRDQPIFSFVNLMGAHVPYAPPRWALKRFLQPALGRTAAAQLIQQMNRLQVDVDHWLAMTLDPAEFSAAMTAIYQAEVAAQDAHIGVLLQQLRQAGSLDDLCVVVAADHGDHLGEKQRLNHAFGIYQGLAHVPLLVRPPRADMVQGKKITPFASTRRIFHTLLTIAQSADEEEQALSLLNIGVSDEQNQDGEKGIAYAEAPPLNWAVERLEKNRPGVAAANGYGKGARAAFQNGHKLIHTGDSQKELFDLRKDPMELENLFGMVSADTTALDELLSKFDAQHRPVVDNASSQAVDPALLDQLRDLGYVE